MCSMKASLQFVSYKIDVMKLDVQDKVGVICAAYNGQEDWSFLFGLMQPSYLKGPDIYISGVNAKTMLGSVEKPEVSLFVNVTGIFKKDGEQFGEGWENFIKAQMPAVLSPFLRTAITNILAMAGFGQVVPPLVNFHKMSKELLGDKPIIEHNIDVE